MRYKPSGSILAVTISDQHSPGKTERFVGICIKREGCGLRASFILRNVIDNEVCYENFTYEWLYIIFILVKLDIGFRKC